jgi:HlyD family secretion protein
MNRKLVAAVAAAVVAVAALAWWGFARLGGGVRYTGFVEGEERVLRSEVTGRVLAVPFGEGDAVAANAVVARLDDDDILARLEAKKRELEVTDAQIGGQEERVGLVEKTWPRDLAARRAEVSQAEAAATLAQRSLVRERELAATGASTAQNLDDARARAQEAASALERARQVLARVEAEERNITLAEHDLDTLRRRRELILAQIGELEVTHEKYLVRAPAVATVVQTQFAWPGELAQPGTSIVSVLDPVDKYVQVYVPVPDLDRFPVGRRVAFEPDSEPGRRYPGEVSFVADTATFTPEKIETRSDRLGQVYRAKVRILEGVERLAPGTEGNVYLVEGAG